MMNIIRAVLGAIILFFDKAFLPKATVRAPDAQAKLDQLTSHLSLYQFEACPFCVKVRRAIKGLGMNIELRDVKKNREFNKELVREGGQFQVPCLRISKSDGTVQWMYESSDIIRYLEGLIAS